LQKTKGIFWRTIQELALCKIFVVER
jgi:hypothetical protein